MSQDGDHQGEVPPEGEEACADATAPDARLAELYKSLRPPVELVPGVGLSAVVNAAWLPSDAKVSGVIIVINKLCFS